MTEFFDFFETQERVSIICEAIADRVRARASPSAAIANELRLRFPDRTQLDAVDRYPLALTTQFAAEYLRGHGHGR